MASASSSAAAMGDQNVSRKPSKLLARSNTLHRSPHGHSGSGAGLWLANTPSPKSTSFRSPSPEYANSPEGQQIASSKADQKKRVYHFPAELARASFGVQPLTLGGKLDYDQLYAAPGRRSEDGDVDLDLSFDYISRYDRSTSSGQQDSSGSAFDSSRERVPPLTSHFSPDDTPELIESSTELQQGSGNSTADNVASTSADSLEASPGSSKLSNSNSLRSMRANAAWDKRRKAPPAPLDLTPGSEARRQRQLALQKAQQQSAPASSQSLSAGPSSESIPTSFELVGKSVFSPATPAPGHAGFPGDFGAASQYVEEEKENLPVTPLSATRRGSEINKLPLAEQGRVSSESNASGSHDSGSIRRVASTSATRLGNAKRSLDNLRQTPTLAAHSKNATPIQSRRPRSHSNRSFRASASLASLGPPPFPPPNEPLPSPLMSASYHSANDAASSIRKSIRARPSASSIDLTNAVSSSRSRTTLGHRSSLDSFQTVFAGITAAPSSSSIATQQPRTATAEMPPPLPALQRYEAIFSGQNDWDAPRPSTTTSTNALSGGMTSLTLGSAPMATSTTIGSSATTMTWSPSDQSTPSVSQKSLTPFSPTFSDPMPGTAGSTKTQFTAVTPPSVSIDAPFASKMGSLTGVAAKMTVQEAVEGRGNRNTERWILTQRERKALLQHEELASHERLLAADHTVPRLSIRADERASRLLAEAKEKEDAEDARSRQVSGSSDSTDVEQSSRARQTMVISTVSTPDESGQHFNFTSGQLSLMPLGPGMQRAASADAAKTLAGEGAKPMTRNRNGTTGPWPQSPLLLNFDVDQGKSSAKDSSVSPALTTIIHSEYATPQVDQHYSQDEGESRDGPLDTIVQGLGLGLEMDYGIQRSPVVSQGSAPVTGFAPHTTELLRKASRVMNRHPSDADSPHLSINMSSELNLPQNTKSNSQRALLTRGSRQDLTNDAAQGSPSLAIPGPSPALPNDPRSPRTVSAKDIGSSASGGLNARVNDLAVNRAQVPTPSDRTLLQSQSIASSISAFVYNPTPAAPTSADVDPLHRLHVPEKPKTGSIGWRRNARASRDHAHTLGQGMRTDKHHQDSTDVKFVHIDLDDGGLQTEVTLNDELSRSHDSAKAGQWVTKLWSAVASPRRSSFRTGDVSGDRTVDVELAEQKAQTPEPVQHGQKTVSGRSFRPLSLIEKRQSGVRQLSDSQRRRLRSATPGEDDEIAEKDARAVALRLLAGSAQVQAAPAAAEQREELQADLSAEEREKERIDALKKLRRMSALERQRKRNSGIGYITSPTLGTGARLPDLPDADDKVEQQGECQLTSKQNKRMSMTVFGGKERASMDPQPRPTGELAAAAVLAERAWLDAMRSPRMADSPSGFTPRMMFEPQDWGASASAQHQKAPANHIPLMLSSSATSAARAAPAPLAPMVNDHGLSLSELHRARDEMRRLAGQGMSTKDEQYAYEEQETFHTPMPDIHGTWGYAKHDHRQHYAHVAPQSPEQPQSSALGDFGISPPKNTRLHQRSRTARFAVDEPNYAEDEDSHPAVSIFTRRQPKQRHHRGTESFSVQYSPSTQHPLNMHRTKSKRHRHGRPETQLFGTPASLLEGNAPSKNMFYAGFLGMPWLWMIGGWYLTADGQLRNPSADDHRRRDKVDVWQHEPSMHQSSPNPAAPSQYAERSHNWSQGESTGLPGMPSYLSYAVSSSGTAGSAQTTDSDPNRPPPSRIRKSKTRSLGTLLDTNPQVSFYQSPVRVVQEPMPTFGGAFKGHMAPMYAVPEVEEPRRSRLFAGQDDIHYLNPSPHSTDSNFSAPSPAFSDADEVYAHTKPQYGYATATATRTSVGTPWRDLERYVLLNRVAAILSGVLVFAGFTGAICAVVTNF